MGEWKARRMAPKGDPVQALLDSSDIPVTLRGVPWNHLAMLLLTVEQLLLVRDASNGPPEIRAIHEGLKRAVRSLKMAFTRAEVAAEDIGKFKALAEKVGIEPPSVIGIVETDEAGEHVGPMKRVGSEMSDRIWEEGLDAATGEKAGSEGVWPDDSVSEDEPVWADDSTEHVCGLQGFGAPEDRCPACEQVSRTKAETGD